MKFSMFKWVMRKECDFLCVFRSLYYFFFKTTGFFSWGHVYTQYGAHAESLHLSSKLLSKPKWTLGYVEVVVQCIDTINHLESAASIVFLPWYKQQKRDGENRCFLRCYWCSRQQQKNPTGFKKTYIQWKILIDFFMCKSQIWKCKKKLLYMKNNRI